jgi:ParB family transcriptional regulator, chromosome partitioning protein
MTMAKRRSTAELLDAAHSAGAAIQQQDRVTEALAELHQSRPAFLPLAKISNRTIDTRTLNIEHVNQIAESITTLGLLEPLVVDNRGKLLAGGHRLAAIHLLKEDAFDQYLQHFNNDLIPVRVIDFDSEDNPDLALQIEVTENEKRRDYTSKEVRSLAERLKSAGYIDVKGRPVKGGKALRPALELIVGKSLRTVRRYLNEEIDESRTSVTLSDSEKEMISLRRVRSELIRWQNAYPEPRSENMQLIAKDITRLHKRIETIMKKLEKSV